MASEQAILANRVLGAEGRQHPLFCPEGFPGSVGAVGAEPTAAEPTARADPLASNGWCRAFAAATVDHAAAAAVTVINPASAGVGNVSTSVPQKARAAGRLLRQAWLRPASLMDKLEEKSADWRRQETLADAIVWLLEQRLR